MVVLQLLELWVVVCVLVAASVIVAEPACWWWIYGYHVTQCQFCMPYVYLLLGQSSSNLLESRSVRRPDPSSLLKTGPALCSVFMASVIQWGRGNHGPPLRAIPDFAQVYSFIGNVFDPNKSNHLQKLMEMNPINVDTVLLLMRNLSMNISSSDFEDQASTYKPEHSMVPPSLQLAIRSNTLHILIKQLRKQCRKGLNFVLPTLYKHEISVELYIYNGSGHGD
ncbi:hypothetical protein MKW98_003754, partial [Papaver atlanticum]